MILATSTGRRNSTRCRNDTPFASTNSTLRRGKLQCFRAILFFRHGFQFRKRRARFPLELFQERIAPRALATSVPRARVLRRPQNPVRFRLPPMSKPSGKRAPGGSNVCARVHPPMVLGALFFRISANRALNVSVVFLASLSSVESYERMNFPASIHEVANIPFIREERNA